MHRLQNTEASPQTQTRTMKKTMQHVASTTVHHISPRRAWGRMIQQMYMVAPSHVSHTWLACGDNNKSRPRMAEHAHPHLGVHAASSPRSVQLDHVRVFRIGSIPQRQQRQYQQQRQDPHEPDGTSCAGMWHVTRRHVSGQAPARDRSRTGI
mmetsp:Transcript_4102/g.8916  ORF Transcript_4102/g.8916 Transcript_4102/m.8916 type:complete len:152 (+) Transcript_4102:312-767(+)